VDREKSRRPPDIYRFTHTHSTAIASQSYQQMQHDNNKVAILKDCDAIPGLRRALGPQRGDYYGRLLWQRGGTLDVKLLELLCFTRVRYKAKVTRALKLAYDGPAKSLAKGAEKCESLK